MLYEYFICLRILTVYADFYPFADRRRHRICGDAQVGTHVQPTDPMEFQSGLFPFGHLKIHKINFIMNTTTNKQIKKPHSRCNKTSNNNNNNYN